MPRQSKETETFKTKNSKKKTILGQRRTSEMIDWSLDIDLVKAF